MNFTRLRSIGGMGAAGLGLAVLAVIVGGTYVMSRGGAVVKLQPESAAVVARGQVVYSRECASCHGAQLEGQPNWRQPGADGVLPAPPHDASGHTWHHPDDLLLRIVKYGTAKVANMPDYRSGMPVYEGKLSDEEIVAALSYIKSRWPPSVRARHDELNQSVGPSR